MTTVWLIYAIGFIGVLIGVQGRESRCTFRHWMYASILWPICAFVLLGEIICEKLDAALQRAEE